MFGLLNLNKPPEWTSRRVVNRVQKYLRRHRCGHAGTLDPLATGVLVLCVGRATRLLPFVQRLPKTYEATFRLGLSSDTDDITGQCEHRSVIEPVDAQALEQLLPEFLGRIEQVPPRYSAVHVNGKRAYELARNGQPVELQPRPVRIDSLELLSFGWPDFSLRIRCGSGTYVRSIGRDLGERLGTGAVMTSLVRTAIGPFTLDKAIDPEAVDRQFLKQSLLPVQMAFPGQPEVCVSSDDESLLANGRSIEWPANCNDSPPEDGEIVLLCSPTGRLLAVSSWDSTSEVLAPSHVFVASNRHDANH